MAESMGLTPLITEEDFNFAMGFTDDSHLAARFKAARDNFNHQYRQLRQADGQYDEPDNDRVFHLFPKLPAELQLLVWKHAVKSLPVPKTQAFDFDLAYDPHAAPVNRAGNGVIACFKPKYVRVLAGHRGLLMACVDSRKTFLDSGDYHMLSLTYLVGPADEEPSNKQKKEESFMEYVEKSNEWFNRTYGATKNKKINQDKKTPPKVKEAPKNPSQADKTFVHVVLPVNFADTRFLIDKIAAPFSYNSIHPAAPSPQRAFTQAAGLEFIHSIKKLAFSMDKMSWNTNLLFCDWFATSPQHYRPAPGASHYTLGALEELSYVSTIAFKRQCCIGHDPIWHHVPGMKVQKFERELKDTGRWPVRDLYRVHLILMGRWRSYDQFFNSRWAPALRQKCTCRR